MNTLIIIESPHKINTIKSFLGKGYRVVASQGHLRDLPKSKLGIDIENDFAPGYINVRGRGPLITALKKEAKWADRIILATDPDREGEAISWHLAAVLGLKDDEIKRIRFNEVTKSSLQEALKNITSLDMNQVDAQQARRILDRLVGYKVSPFLWKKVKNGLSAGRVQSVATRLIVEREEEIRAFVAEEYWSITIILAGENGELVKVRFHGDHNGKIDLNNQESVNTVLSAIDGQDFLLEEIKKSVKNRKPQAPFTTSTLQQEANRRLNFQSQRTMMVAQELYEGVNLGEKSTHGLITYMRTDSLRISAEATELAKNFIVGTYGDAYYPETPNVYKSKKNSQDAHEAIRPVDPAITPDSIKKRLSADQYKLYKMIWERFLASQMSPAQIDTVSCDFTAGGYVFRASGESVKFPGYKALYDDAPTEENSEQANTDTRSSLSKLKKDSLFQANETKPEQHFTQPPARYNEGSLVRAMEEMGIGRPSTYTPTITTIISRGYVKRESKSLVPTELGFVTTSLLKESFESVIDYEFTARMEENLDKVENGSVDYISVIREFYTGFAAELEEAEKKLEGTKIELTREETDIVCEKCGARMIVKEGRFGKFAACPNYPTCRNTKPLNQPGEETADGTAAEVVADIKCKNCGGDMILRKGAFGSFFACRNYPDCKTTVPYYKDSGVACPACGKRILIKQSKSRKTFYSCEGYPDCDFSVWDPPQERKCPDCGGLVLKKKNKESYYCYKKCGWSETISEESKG